MLTGIAQISDPHVGLHADYADSIMGLERAVAAVCELDPAPVAVLLTGDLTYDGNQAEYARVLELLEPLQMPVYPIPGNHDRRANLREAFSDHPGIAAAGEFLDYAVDCGPVRVINLDTQIEGEAGGAIGSERFAWIERELANAEERPVILAMHHAPVGVGLAEFDAIGLAQADRDALRELFESGPAPELIITGHIHRGATAQIGGVPVFICPSVHRQVTLDLRREDQLRMGNDPPAIALHLHGADPRLVSHVIPLTRTD
ncbi:MAG: 3,5-cyclic-AMP phosphodiesterase [Solirubrobacterales bacterium]|nr:3,5-cyclic-AMP phosphodiesterase [Solirubrobacterales bacterium]